MANRYKTWTQAEDDYLRRHFPGCTDTASLAIPMATATGMEQRTKTAINQRAYTVLRLHKSDETIKIINLSKSEKAKHTRRVRRQRAMRLMQYGIQTDVYFSQFPRQERKLRWKLKHLFGYVTRPKDHTIYWTTDTRRSQKHETRYTQRGYTFAKLPDNEQD